MSAKLRSVNTNFWVDPFIEELNPTEKLLFLYLLTNPLTNLMGVYEISLKRISYDTGLNQEMVRKGFERFETVRKAFYVDNYIIIPNFLKNQNLNANMKKAVVKSFNELPTSLKNRLLGNGLEGLPNDSEGFEMVRLSFGKYKIEIEEEIEKEIEKEIEEENGFDLFWEKYDKKVGDKKKCEKKWDSLSEKTRNLIMDILPAWLSQFKEKQFQPYPLTFLNQERWNDELPKIGKVVNMSTLSYQEKKARLAAQAEEYEK